MCSGISSGNKSFLGGRGFFLGGGGFAPRALMEEVVFSARLRGGEKKKLPPPPVRSCAQMQITQGPWKVTLRNCLFLILFRCGVSPKRLHAWYYSGSAV